jgi:hypothetical protein
MFRTKHGIQLKTQAPNMMFNWKDCVTKIITRWCRICKFVNISPLDVPCISRGIENISPLCFYTMIVSQWWIGLATVQVWHAILKLYNILTFTVTHLHSAVDWKEQPGATPCHESSQHEDSMLLVESSNQHSNAGTSVCVRETMCVRESTNNNVMPIPDKSICCWQVLCDDRSKAITSSTIVCRVPPTGCAWIQILACFGINNTAFSDSYNIWADIGGSWVFDIFFVPHWLWTCGPMISWKVDFPNQQKSNISPWVPFIIDLISHSLQVS